jgi:predicted O-methyltransferase YrrM
MKNSAAKICKKFIGKTEGDPNMLPAVGLDWHESFIAQLASILRPKVYVELGLYQCVVFNQIVPFAEKLIGVDIETSAGKYMTKSPKTEFFLGTTQEFAKKIYDKPLQIDMLFIDADHSKEAVLRDFRSLFPFVTPHGIILLHDTHPGDKALTAPEFCGTAYLAISELVYETKEYEMVTIPVSPGLTICRKRKAQLSWEVE